MLCRFLKRSKVIRIASVVDDHDVMEALREKALHNHIQFFIRIEGWQNNRNAFHGFPLAVSEFHYIFGVT